MTDDDLKDLFAQALLDEPDRIVSPDEDIARGRVRRSRRRRRRVVAGVVAVATVGALGLVVPDAFDDLRVPGVEAAAPGYDELPPFEPALRFASQPASMEPPADDSLGQSASLRTSAGVQPVEMLPAIRTALPAGVVVSGGASEQQVGRHRLVFSVERDGVPFTLRVWWQTGAEPSAAFQPCAEPVAAFSRTAVWDDCTRTPVNGATFEVLGTPDPRHRVLAVDNGMAAITVVWETAEDEQVTPPRDVLSDDEAKHIADSAWQVVRESTERNTGNGRGNLVELRSDFGMGYVAASWSNVDSALTSVLGPLTRVRSGQHGPGVLNGSPGSVPSESPQAVTASYRTVTGATVDLAIWDAGMMYGALCTNLLACDVWPGSRDYFRPILMSPADAMGGTSLGNQGQVYLVLDGVGGDAAAVHQATMEAIFSVLPDPS